MRTIFLFLFIFTPWNTMASANSISEVFPTKSEPSLTEYAFLRFLGPTILKIMEEHGDNKLYMNERIELITYNVEKDSCEVTLHVIGFEGPHNPPYNFIRMVIRIPAENYENYEVISYKHHLYEMIE